MEPRPRLLLLQTREDPRVRQEEYKSFIRYSGLEPENIDLLNVFDQPIFPADVVSGYDGLLVGGASEASVLEPGRFAFLPYAKSCFATAWRRRSRFSPLASDSSWLS